MNASANILLDKALIAEEVKEHGYTYISILEKKEDYAVHLLEKGKKHFRTKIYSKKQLFSSPTLRFLLNQENAVGEMIRHNFNYLLAYSDFFYTRSFAMILYDHCPYGSLKTLLNYGELLMEEVFLIVKDLFNGLEELKFLGIIHRNLCPENILIDEKFALKIDGFEFCESHAHRTLSPPDFVYFLKNLKEPQCTPPEALFNNVCTFKAPLYSLGAIFYALFHEGNYHIKEDNLEQIKIRLKNNDVQFSGKEELEKYGELKMVFHGLLQPNPRDRMSFVEIRDLINRMYSSLRDEEEHIRMRILVKIRNIKEKLQAQSMPTIKKGAKQPKASSGAGNLEMKKYTSVFQSPLPAASTIKKLYKLPKEAGKDNKEVLMMNQTIDLAESLRRAEVPDVILRANIKIDEIRRGGGGLMIEAPDEESQPRLLGVVEKPLDKNKLLTDGWKDQTSKSGKPEWNNSVVMQDKEKADRQILDWSTTGGLTSTTKAIDRNTSDRSKAVGPTVRDLKNNKKVSERNTIVGQSVGLLGQTYRASETLSLWNRTFRINDFKRALPKNKLFSQTTRSTMFFQRRDPRMAYYDGEI